MFTLGHTFFETLLPPQVHQSDTTVFGPHTFPDCGETSLLNFFAAIIYNPSNQGWNIEILERMKATPNLIDFFKAHAPNTLNTQSAHNNWAKVVSSLPGVQYSKADICDITPGPDAISNMLKVIKNLIPGITDWQGLYKICNAAGVNIALDIPENLTIENIPKVIHITLGKHETLDLTWAFSRGHFQLDFPRRKEQMVRHLPRLTLSAHYQNDIIAALVTHANELKTIVHPYDLFTHDLERSTVQEELITACVNSQ